MKTKSVTLFYSITQTEVTPPVITEVERKERWIKEVQKTVEADYKPKMIKVVYELYDPEITNMVRFFNGTCVLWYAIQNEEITVGKPSLELVKRYREDLLDEMLGYDFVGVLKTHRMRKSTADFKTVQAWYTFLNTLKETIFDNAGYEFPDSEEFWELVKKHGYENAQTISIKSLQDRLSKKYDKQM